MGGDNCPQPGLTQICCCISWSNVVIISFAVSVDCIKEIRSGKNTDVFREMDRDDIQEDCAFSVIYGEAFETLNLVAYTPDDANIWVTGLRCLVDSDKGNYGIVVLGGWYSHIFPMYCRDVPPVRVSFHSFVSWTGSSPLNPPTQVAVEYTLPPPVWPPLYCCNPFHSWDWSISNFPCSLTNNITSHSMKNLAFHSLLIMILLPILTPSCIHFSLTLSFLRVINFKFPSRLSLIFSFVTHSKCSPGEQSADERQVSFTSNVKLSKTEVEAGLFIEWSGGSRKGKESVGQAWLWATSPPTPSVKLKSLTLTQTLNLTQPLPKP